MVVALVLSVNPFAIEDFVLRDHRARHPIRMSRECSTRKHYSFEFKQSRERLGDIASFKLLTTVLTRLIFPHVKFPVPVRFPQLTELR